MTSAASARRALRKAANPSEAAAVARFFKTAPGQYGEGDRFLAIAVPVLRKLAREYQALPLRDVESLLKSRWHEERLLALFILVRQYGRADRTQCGAIYRLYMRNTARVNNWDLVDCSAAPIVGAHLAKRERRRLRRLAKSDVLWERRIAMLATFHYIKQGEFEDSLAIARLLLDDRHDLIHKAAGWMLREIGNRDRAAEEKFLRRYASRMPRTMLRYAIERFPERLRQRYLAVVGP